MKYDMPLKRRDDFFVVNTVIYINGKPSKTTDNCAEKIGLEYKSDHQLKASDCFVRLLKNIFTMADGDRVGVFFCKWLTATWKQEPKKQSKKNWPMTHY